MDERLMRRAIELSVESVEAGGGPFGAVVARDGEIVAEGTNRVTRDDDPTAHAEVVAIRRACRELGTFHLPGCEIYTSCEPCPMCLGAVYWARLERIWYGVARGDAAAAGFSDHHIYTEIPQAPEARSIPARQVLEEEARRGLHAWNRKDDRVPY